jgi:hypothetical protein
MNIMNLKSGRLRNEEHFQFQTEFTGLVVRYTPSALGIESSFAIYEPLRVSEAEALDVIRKSAVTDEITDADNKRDNTFSGLRSTVEGATSHFMPKKREAANRIQIVLDHFGNINAKSYNEQTAAVKTMIADLNTTYSADLATLNLGDWITELQANNNAFEELMSERYSEASGKTQLKMKQVRLEVDAAYRAITTRIDALTVVNGPENYTPFINELNIRIEKFNNILAQRKGCNEKPDEPVD